MTYHKGVASLKPLLIVFGLVVLLGIGYIVMNPEVLQTPTGKTVTLSPEPTIAWQFTDAGETDNIPHTKVTVVINSKVYETGTFQGSCSEVGIGGGIDGKGLVAGELSAAQCWFAGGGNEIGVFAHEDGGYQIMIGDLSEGEEGSPMFRGDFKIKTDIRP